jgi:predicted AAA+ superfamily ATPase
MINKNTLKEIIVANEEFILKHVKRIVHRKGIHVPETLNKAVVLYGVRRSGKTFILFDLFKKYRDRSLYIDFEDERLTGFQAKDFERLKESMLELKPQLIGKGLVFLLDEVQNIDGWEKFCRRAVERENIKIFVSGSSSKMMPFEIHTELRGRSWSMEILPFSFEEYLHSKGVDVADESILYGPKKALVKRHFYEYLRWGGFPEVSVLESELEKTKLLKEYMSAMFFRDLVERYGITNIPLLESLTDKLFSSFSLKFSMTAFYKQHKDKFPFSKDLLFRYYKYFLQSMLVFEVRKFAESAYVRMRNPAKLYLVDTGLCRRVTSADSGRLLENAVYLELRRRGYEVFYFEGKRECDFIAKTGEEILLPVQVSFDLNEGNREREIGGLAEACRELGLSQGTIITYDEEDELTADGVDVKIVPVWKWIFKVTSASFGST